MSAVELRHLEKRFGGVPVLDGLSLDVRSGEYLVLLGASGSGKTTILNVISGLIASDKGTVMIGGRNVTRLSPRRRNVAMVFQNDSMYPHLTVGDSLATGLPRSVTAAERRMRIDRAIELVQLPAELLQRKPSQLSGGQLRRAAVAKAIVTDAPVRLFDEPLAALDAEIRDSIQRNLRDIHQQQPTTTIHVTHDGDEAVRLADRIAVIDGGQILQVGTAAELYGNSACRRVAGSLGTPPICYLTVNHSDLMPDLAGVLGLSAEFSGRRIDLGVRAESVRVCPLEEGGPRTAKPALVMSTVSAAGFNSDDSRQICADAVATAATPSLSAAAGLTLEVEFELAGPLRLCSQSSQALASSDSEPTPDENDRGTMAVGRVVASVAVAGQVGNQAATAIVGQRFRLSMNAGQLRVFDFETGRALPGPAIHE